MSSSPQSPVAEHHESSTEAYRPAATAAPAAGASSPRPARTFTARVTAAIGAGALVVGAGLGLLTGGLVGGPPGGGPGGGPGGTPPGASQSQDGTGTGTGTGTAPDGTGTGSTTGTATGT